MAPPLELSIPSTILSSAPNEKPYTLYNITLRLPLRTFVVQKRYSDFVTLHSSLCTQVSSPPPAPLPGKTWFKSTINSPELTEDRRRGLETYLRSIAENPDRRWRETSVWRQFLNLPSNSGNASLSSAREGLIAANQRGVGGNAEIMADPQVWLDVHRELKAQLHDARLFLGRRDSANTAAGQYEAGANAKRCLVKAGGLLKDLEEGLKVMGEGEKNGRGEARVGAGELRRRRDLLGSVKVEKEGLEKLAVTLAVKNQASSSSANGGAAATQADKNALFGPGVSRPSGRVLGAPVPETDKTRELDNEGVLQLQKELMQNQDMDVEELGKIVRRQREMGLAIHGELELQNEMLKRVDEDADRVKGKINIAKKRIGKIR
ncbi:putative snare complex subunit protein [Botrytis fragariae]|uniref:Putative snare complex subunit protein n=1 Tax=Botrytis fragariae TaxID=1964551 RepID=A0A8H6AUC7_9HELO|nr:putative snare complex subunit protein [Botrytis fragariae]KAF5873655.1 putative snare complex subunit protein [Botrytis fragariae]